MKIEKLTLKNFLSSQHSVFEFPNTTTVICGRNGSGKTAIHNALQVVLVDKAMDARGINTKSGLKALITKGAKDGYVEATVSFKEDSPHLCEMYKRSLKTGNYTTPAPEINPYLPFILHTKQFGALSPEDRRRFLIELGGVSVNKGSVVKELTTRKCDPAMIEEIAPLLLGGSDGAQHFAKGKARESKGAWRGVTGNTWGANVGETWTSFAEALPDDHEMQVAAVEEDIRNLTVKAEYRGGITGPCPHCGEKITYSSGEFAKAVEHKHNPVEAQADLQQANDLRRRLESQKFLADNEQQTTDKAAVIHKSILGWLNLANELGPEGAPRLVFDRAVKPVNERLAYWSNFFPLISIDTQSRITFDGRVYELLSESQQWLCDAMIAEAIAYQSGLRLLLLDRMDVLDMPNRGQFIRWLKKMQADYDTIIITATMKRAYPFSFCDSFWIKNGRIAYRVGVDSEAEITAWHKEHP